MVEPGFFRGRHFTEFVDEVLNLKRAGRLDDAVELLGHLIEATELEARRRGWGVAPWYYEQLAIICAKRGDREAEVAVLERYEAQPKAPGVGPSKLAQRLARLRRRLEAKQGAQLSGREETRGPTPPEWRPRLMLAGAAGVGKTTLARLCNQLLGIEHLDLDEFRRSSNEAGCGVQRLDLAVCLAEYLERERGAVVIDVGGDTVFRRPPSNNDERLSQVNHLRQAYGISVVLLVADEGVLRERFAASKGRGASEFQVAWNEWRQFGEPYWKRCAARVVNTTTMRLGVASDERRVVEEVLG